MEWRVVYACREDGFFACATTVRSPARRSPLTVKQSLNETTVTVRSGHFVATLARRASGTRPTPGGFRSRRPRRDPPLCFPPSRHAVVLRLARQGARRATQLISHHQTRLSQLKQAAISTPLSVSDAMAVLFGRDFEAHELYFASGEARAHLNHLVACGEMHMVFDKDQHVTYFALSQP